MAGLLKRLVTRAGVAPTPVSEASLVAALGDPALAQRVEVRLSPKARRVSLRLDVTSGVVVLVQPRRMSPKAVLAFAASKRDWIAGHLAALPPRVAFTDGATIPLRGTPHAIRFAPTARGGVWREGSEIVVAGRIEHAPRRLVDWLKAETRAAIGLLARDMADQLGRKVTAVTVRDTSSRWGSCTRGGRLSFSWRLILAPEQVFTYVVAHEVAHLKHMNHGAAFWRTVAALLSGLEEDAQSARHWLRTNGVVLHRYG